MEPDVVLSLCTLMSMATQVKYAITLPSLQNDNSSTLCWNEKTLEDILDFRILSYSVVHCVVTAEYVQPIWVGTTLGWCYVLLEGLKCPKISALK